MPCMYNLSSLLTMCVEWNHPCGPILKKPPLHQGICVWHVQFRFEFSPFYNDRVIANQDSMSYYCKTENTPSSTPVIGTMPRSQKCSSQIHYQQTLSFPIIMVQLGFNIAYFKNECEVRTILTILKLQIGEPQNIYENLHISLGCVWNPNYV